MINLNYFIKQDLSKTFDATFTLLVDASASMHDKMDETIKGVVLFHETLKTLNIKHEILAFNEDAFEADDREQPNIIDEIINYNYSIFEKEGPRIMSLEPQDDNRDGVAIRVASERLYKEVINSVFLSCSQMVNHQHLIIVKMASLIRMKLLKLHVSLGLKF